MMKKPNRNNPATAKQCAEAHEAGVSEGTAEGLAIYLTVMRDKFGKSTEAAYKIYQRTVYQCDAIKIDGHIIARYERELREFIKCDICPQMKNIAKAYKQPKQPIRYKDVEYSRRQGREAGWQFASMVFLLAIRKEWKYTKTQLLRVYAAACEMRESIREKYINVPDLESVLLEEGKIKVV